MPAALKGLMKIEEKHEPIKGELIFTRLSSAVLFDILKYLKPVEVLQFVRLDQKLEQAYLESAYKREDYFKSICEVLFPSAIPRLPELSPFLPLKEYILARPLEFGPNIRHAVETDLRHFIWHCKPESFYVNPDSHLITYGSYEGIYRNAHRLNFNGFYCLRERYTKRGDYSLDTPGRPLLVIYYYRYVRFFPDGMFLYKLSNRKLKDEEVKTDLSRKKLSGEDDNVMRGEFMQYMDQVYLRFARSTSVFFYECRISTQRIMRRHNRVALRHADGSQVLPGNDRRQLSLPVAVRQKANRRTEAVRVPAQRRHDGRKRCYDAGV